MVAPTIHQGRIHYFLAKSISCGPSEGDTEGIIEQLVHNPFKTIIFPSIHTLLQHASESLEIHPH